MVLIIAAVFAALIGIDRWLDGIARLHEYEQCQGAGNPSVRAR